MMSHAPRPATLCALLLLAQLPLGSGDAPNRTDVVDMPRRRSTMGGVAVHESPRGLGSAEAREWFVQLPPDLGTDAVDQWGGRFGQASGGEVVWKGHPSAGGACGVIFRGTPAELGESLRGTSGAMWVEEAFEVQALGPLRGGSGHRQEGGRRLARQRVDESLWGLDRIDDTAGLDGSYDNRGLTGAGVHVYVLDTGIRTTHSEFEGRAIPEVDFVERRLCNGDANCAVDRDGHGTHCAGTIAGRTVGVAKEAVVHAVKVLGDDGRGSTADIIRAIDFVASEGQRPAVISMSLGCGAPCQSQAEARAIEAATAAGVVVVVAAGNNGNTNRPDACDYAPSDVPQAITVGSITINDDLRSSFSNVGGCLDIFAPGSDILSASAADDTSGAILSGTSMACPHVSGVAALVLGGAPDMSAAEVEAVLTGEALEGSVVDPRGSPNRLLFTGGIAAAIGAESGASRGVLAAAVALGVAVVLGVVACLAFRCRKGRCPRPSDCAGMCQAVAKHVPEGITKQARQAKVQEPPKHDWKVASFRSPKWCQQCRSFLWGVSNQGYTCSQCHQVVCKKCTASGEPGLQRCKVCDKPGVV